MFLGLKLKLVTERNTEKKQSLTRDLVLKTRQHLSFWICLATASCICRRWIRKETLILQPTQQHGLQHGFDFSTEMDALMPKRLCALFNSRNLIYYIMGELMFSLAFYLAERKQGHIAKALLSYPKIQFTGMWNGSTFRSHSSSNYISHLPVLDAVSGQLLQQTEACRCIPAKEYQVEWQPFFSCHQKWGSKCFAQPSVIF